MPVFTLQPVPEVHLPLAPLAKVLTQVQFSRTPGLVSDSAEAAIAEVLARYPVRRQGVAASFAFAFAGGGPAFPVAQPAPSAMRMFSEPTGTWQVTITETSVALETTGYDTRDDFCARATEVMVAVAAVALPPVVDRVGLRYISRLTGDDLGRIGEYIEPEFRVLHGAIGDGLSLEHSVSDSVLRIADDERMQIRSGLLPPGGGFDPSLAPLPEPSWLLDLDVFTVQGGFPFHPPALAARLRRYAEHAYSFFRYATTDDFQRAFAQPTPDQDRQA